MGTAYCELQAHCRRRKVRVIRFSVHCPGNMHWAKNVRTLMCSHHRSLQRRGPSQFIPNFVLGLQHTASVYNLSYNWANRYPQSPQNQSKRPALRRAMNFVTGKENTFDPSHAVGA